MSEVHKLYDYSYETGKITLKNRKCPRCGSVMAKHTVGGARWSCGKCGYTEYIKGARF
ncbi:MAG: 30S ribosomal protein S27ae [Candidatus Marsarchaeota archaeon]